MWLLTALLLILSGREPAPLALALNLPAYRLDAYEHGRLVRRYAVAIGAPTHPTPVGGFTISRVELNPTWTPPASAWARGRAPAAPGPQNPMGRAKLLFLPLYFLHGSPDSVSIGSAASHGCVRLANTDVLDLAGRALAAGRPELSEPERRRALADPVRTSRFPLTRPIGIAVRYELLEIVDDTVRAWPDPYRRRTAATDSAAQRLLELAVAPHPVPGGLGRRLLDAARRRPAALPLASLRAPRPPAPIPGPPVAAAPAPVPPCPAT